MLDRLLSPLARRWKWLAAVLAVQRRFEEVHGGYLASAITLAAFVSIFPLLIVATAVLGFFSAGDVDFAARVVEQLGLTGRAATLVTDSISVAETSRRAASVLGLTGLLLSGLGLVAALQYANDEVWQVRTRGFRDRLVGLAWLVGAVLILAASFALTTALRWLPAALAPLDVAFGAAVGTVLFLWSGRVLPNRTTPRGALLPGAVFGGVALEVLKLAGTYYVPHLVRTSSALYGSIGTTFAILAWLAIFSRVIVYSTVLNVVRWEREHGTVRVVIEVPSLEQGVPLDATRDGDIEHTAPRRESTDA